MASAVGVQNDYDLIRRALSELSHTGPGDPGLTAQEIADLMGTTNINRARAWIDRMRREGRIVAGKRPYIGIDGRRTKTNVYRLKETP